MPSLHSMLSAQPSAVPTGERAHFALPSGDVVSCAIMEVTPEIAKAWLRSEHPRNRDTPTVAARYAVEMANDGWEATPEPIIKSSSGLLIDGGNRLRAIEKSGKTVVLVVWFDWPERAFACLNRGTSRSLIQADSMVGDAMPRSLYQMGRYLVVLDENRTIVSDSEVRRVARALQPAWQAMGVHLDAIRIGTSGLRAPAKLAICIAWMSEPSVAQAFVSELAQAADHAAVPSPAVRNFIRWYSNSDKAGGRTAGNEAACATSSAIRQFAGGLDVKFIKASDEAWAFWRNKKQVRGLMTGA